LGYITLTLIIGVSSALTFAVILRQYSESVSVLRILQPEGGA
jgi:hypothetical protein